MTGLLQRVFSPSAEEAIKVFDAREIRLMQKSPKWHDKWGSAIYLRVDNEDRVVEAAPCLRGRKENVHLIGLPLIWTKPLTRHLTVELRPHEKGFGVSIDVELAVEYIDDDWDCQQLYDVVVPKGFTHIEAWLKAEFINTAIADNCVLQSFENYKRSQDCFAFFEKLTRALQPLPFEGHCLSCIGTVTAKVEIETAKVQAVAVYK